MPHGNRKDGRRSNQRTGKGQRRDGNTLQPEDARNADGQDGRQRPEANIEGHRQRLRGGNGGGRQGQDRRVQQQDRRTGRGLRANNDSIRRGRPRESARPNGRRYSQGSRCVSV